MRRLSLVVLTLLFVVTAIQAQIKEVSMSSKSANQYKRADFVIRLVGNWQNPYLQEQVALDMVLKAPSGKELTLPCYYESGKSGELSTWAARFTPQESGKYEYTFKLSENGKTTSSSKSASFESKASNETGILHTGDNWILKFDNGTPFRGVAENICWESRDNDDSKFFKELHQQKDKYNYEYMLPLFAKSGGNFFRVWMCSWNFPIDQQKNFNNSRYTPSDEYMNPSAIQKLDRLIDLSQELDLYIMLCIGQGNANANHEFFASDQAKTRYKNHLRYIVARWSYSPSIGMWEFFNEIDNIQFRNAQNPIPAKDIVQWHTEMSKYLKQIDPFEHIVTTSISHRDLEGLNSVPDIDINQKHIYKNTPIMPSEIIKYEKEFGKPYIIGEFGYEWDWSKNFDDFAEDMDLDFKRGLWYGIFSPTPVTPMSWWWEYFDNRNMVGYFKGVREINDKMLKNGEGKFTSLTAECGKADAFSVKCGKVIYAYLYNDTSESVKNNFAIGADAKGKFKVESFDPTTCKYKKLAEVNANGKIILNNIELSPKNEVVYIFTPVL